MNIIKNTSKRLPVDPIRCKIKNSLTIENLKILLRIDFKALSPFHPLSEFNIGWDRFEVVCWRSHFEKVHVRGLSQSPSLSAILSLTSLIGKFDT